ncbi:SF1B family DNA helicase RecD2 [Desertibacillus haloalkaliphilus]|uniref:SF1B family DNA helicase RecD2 n=1 Tax=Desertibacillus haloalkaliphilus TaxID=1328930 RepID=UPI001C27824C|nr:ATP-dependent RecD-like DNA helicase [Desertibacillus haloalkaliphilus]MBU8905532.1 ATP-dependent RecD-like DNA helicase [Desertibacillus haloalkaliphilus]
MENQSSLEQTNEQQTFIKGELEHLIFHNEDNFYTVAKIKIHETTEAFEEKSITVVGVLPRIEADEVYLFFGNFKEHPKFGLQYQVEQFRKDIPQTAHGIIQYLSSDRFYGIGKKMAEQIVRTLGEHAISMILENPSVLENVPKLTEAKANLLYETLVAEQGVEQVIIALAEYGFGTELAMKIYQVYGEETLNTVKENPYQLISDVEGIGFKKADALGASLGISGNHPDRIRAGCLYLLQEVCLQDGHVFMPFEQLTNEVSDLLSDATVTIENEDIREQIIRLNEELKLVLEEDRVYVLSLYFAEKGLATNLKRMMIEDGNDERFPESEFLKALGELEERLGIEYAPSQKEAIQTALSSPIMLLTGGPGTGKTTVIKGIVETYATLHGVSLDPKDYKKEEPFPVLLVAPTGRAAKRMSEATGLPAFTIHRLLGWKGGHSGFEKDEDNPLEGSLLIVDEVSMVDIWLANQLFKALPDAMQVILVGDEDQLPSVGPGQVFSDLLKANMIPTVRLTDIYRQAEGSSIIQMAHDMKRGHLPPDVTEAKPDRRFFPCQQDQVDDVIEQICRNASKKGYTAKDIQVLAPMYRGNAGISRLNVLLQNLFNPKTEQKREITFGDTSYRTGDIVLQLVNNPEENVYNGDRGEIVSIFYAKENVDKEDQLVVSFDGIEVVYPKKDLNQITLAYCTSIHKSQGSEFPIVIMPIVKGYYRMLQRNLIYTGITRAKDYLILCGEMSALNVAIERQDESNRQSMLKEKLRDALEDESKDQA